MSGVRWLASGLLLAGGLTCAAVTAQTQTLILTEKDGKQVNAIQLQSESDQLAHQYVEAKKEEEKREIRKHLLDVLSRQFDLHIQAQQKELEDLEKQLARLKEVLKKRLDAKTTIVERRLEQLIQEAEGLGWNAPSSPQSILRFQPKPTGTILYGDLQSPAPGKR